MYLDGTKRQEISAKYGTFAKDTGSVESQVALFTYRIQHLMEYLRENKEDSSASRSLKMLIGKHRRLFGYLAKKDIKRYHKFIAKLGIRHTTKF